MGLLLEEFSVLSGAARNFARSHPREERAAVAAALEAVASQREVEDFADVRGRGDEVAALVGRSWSGGAPMREFLA